MKTSEQGLFIVCEGIDGCGKGTQAEKLVEYLFRMNKRHHILYTREPGRSQDGVKVRNSLKEEQDPRQRALEMTESFVNDRKDHVCSLVQPVLNYGGIVVCDRYKHSTFAYQSTQGIPLDKLMEMHKDLLVPDLTLIFDVPVEVALERVKNDAGRDRKEVFEKNKGFQEKLRNAYLQLPKQLKGENIKIIDGNRTVDDVFQDVISHVDPLLGKVA